MKQIKREKNPLKLTFILKKSQRKQKPHMVKNPLKQQHLLFLLKFSDQIHLK
jgi:hypothetical protein